MIRRVRSWLTRQRLPASALRIERPGPEVATLLALAGLQVVAAAAAGLAIRAHPLRIWDASDWLQDWWYAGGFKLVVMLGATVALMRRWGLGPDDVLLGWKISLRSVLVVVLAWLGGFVLNAGRIPEVGEALARHGLAESCGRVAVGLFLALMTAAVPEELLYRGLLQGRLERVAGRVVAVVVTAVLFTAWHLPSRFFNASGVEGTAGDMGSVLVGTGLPVLVIGLLFGWSWDRHRNLPALVAAVRPGYHRRVSPAASPHLETR